ncbi:MAG: hypothetical protein IKS09_08340 [Lachnospiraceae bacterium]|nr:hypothetical protein [Lachnospiraceae bacterium]
MMKQTILKRFLLAVISIAVILGGHLIIDSGSFSKMIAENGRCDILKITVFENGRQVSSVVPDEELSKEVYSRIADLELYKWPAGDEKKQSGRCIQIEFSSEKQTGSFLIFDDGYYQTLLAVRHPFSKNQPDLYKNLLALIE